MSDSAGVRRVVTRDQVVRGGCRFFLRHGMVDMDGLALTLAISRATLYRVVHSRDGLLGDVLWLLAERTLSRARKQRRRSGVDGVLEVTWRFVEQLRMAAAFRTFLRSEPETAARVLFNASAGVHPRAVSAQREILVEAGGAAESWSAATLDQVAFLYVRIVESALYAELFGGVAIEPELAERAARAVLTHGATAVS
ncbi:QsdR family transcriptional regulator [Kibdelosporangium persicum]|uniref:TetR family transcriptional regulator n=1 Tax=Kibdelosporangium persicum TaxID=2698649 RepID=A0ABX2FJ27_9PSEU|nr:QsdR family transcriptional regulator [Kibdelosporangium persicum]NRN70771.1 TetR family transcriptional regulator [Kibdelosporangium persicum]